MTTIAFTTSSPALPKRVLENDRVQHSIRLRRPRSYTPLHGGACKMSAAPAEGRTTSDWRAFRAHLLATYRLQRPTHHHESALFDSVQAHEDGESDKVWAHRLPHVEVGACLVADSRHQWPKSFAHLKRAVVVVTDVRPTGLSGLLLNRPTRFTVATHASVLARVGKEFLPNRVMLGGDCSTGSLDMLHPFTPYECPGATAIIPGLSHGGFNAARMLVRDGRAPASAFRFFVAYAKWTHDSFNAEMERGAWNIIACAPSLLLSSDANDPNHLWNTLNSFL